MNHNLRFLIGRKHSEVSTVARATARWSAGTAVATWAFQNISIPHEAHGLFASLNADARSSLACVAQIPVFVPAILFVFALQLTYGSFYLAVRQTLVGSENQFGISFERGVLVNSLLRGLPRAWRRWHPFGWWLIAGLAGAVTVAITGALLRTAWDAWLVWALVAVGGWCVAKLEDVLTDRRYCQVLPLRKTERQEALRRAAEWRALRPGDTSAMPWLYAYSRLSNEELQEQWRELGSSGPIGLTSTLCALVVVVLLYSLLPVPDVSRFQSQGLAGCIFDSVHGLAGVAEENFRATVIAAATLLVLMPVSVLFSYLRFTIRHRFPPPVIAQVLARETGFALRMPLYSVVLIPLVACGIAVLLGWSAVVADRWNSPIAGTLVLVLPATAIAWAFHRIKLRGPLPR